MHETGCRPSPRSSARPPPRRMSSRPSSTSPPRPHTPQSGSPPRSRPGRPRAPASTSTAPSSWPRRSTSTTEREHDVVLLGASGFTGGLTAEYLAGHAGATRWALAGRNRAKLEAVRDRLGVDVPLLIADVTDEESIRRVAESARVVITTVGPYIHYGEPVVAACAAAGTHYVDLTGEPEFVDLMWLRHPGQAPRAGGQAGHSCGFDSIPYDLGAFYAVGVLPEDVPIKLEGFVRASGTFSGGTLHSAVHIMARLRQGRQVAGRRKQLESRPDG